MEPRLVRLHVFDPFPFGLLTMVVSLEAIFLSIFVLMAQKRESAIAELREELALQVNLRIEEEMTKTLQLVAGLYTRLGHRVAEDPELADMMQPLDVAGLERALASQIAAASAARRMSPRPAQRTKKTRRFVRELCAVDGAILEDETCVPSTRSKRSDHTQAVDRSERSLARSTRAQSKSSCRQLRAGFVGTPIRTRLASDGNAPGIDVARWYKAHGYAFVVITDHEVVTDVDPLNAELAEPDKFLVLRGQEITQKVVDSLAQDGRRQAHVVAIGISTPILPLGEKGNATGTTMEAVYARNIGAVRAARGLAQINHPNFRWSVRRDGSDACSRLHASMRSGTVIRG